METYKYADSGYETEYANSSAFSILVNAALYSDLIYYSEISAIIQHSTGEIKEHMQSNSA